MNDIAAVFNQLTLGVYVVCVTHGGRRHAFTAAWVMQASYDPPLLALSINPQDASYSLLHTGSGFAVE